MIYKTKENGKNTRAYVVWQNMHKRCYNLQRQEQQPTYKGCTVSEPWHDFQCFAAWYYEQKGWDNIPTFQLDKDILVPDNKIYSEDTCVLVPCEINMLLTLRQNKRGDLPLGVTQRGKKYRAQLMVSGKKVHLGTFSDPYVAFMSYKQAKENHIKYLVTETEYSELDPRVVKALLDYRVVMEE